MSISTFKFLNQFESFKNASNETIEVEVHRQVGGNRKRAKKKQQRNYGSRYKSLTSNDIYISAEVLLRKNKRKDQKGGKFAFK